MLHRKAVKAVQGLREYLELERMRSVGRCDGSGLAGACALLRL
jgi:hypothetical protein